MTTTSALASARAGMQASERMLEASARTVAALASRGVSALNAANAGQNPSDGVAVSISRAAREMSALYLSDGKPGPGPSDLVQQAVSQSVAVALYRANVQLARNAQEIDNTMQEIVSRSAGT